MIRGGVDTINDVHTKSTWRRWVVLSTVLVAAWLTYVTSNIIFPGQTEPGGQIDAVVSLAPQHDRLATAEQLFLDSGASDLLISYFPNDRYLVGPGLEEEHLEFVGTYCTSADPTYVTCATPEDATTLGETAMMNAAAQVEDWQALTVVTSQYHAFRTRLILDRCLSTELQVNVVFSEADLNVSLWLRFIIYENAAYLKAHIETLMRC